MQQNAAEESSPSSSKQIQAFHPSVRALIVIVRALLASEAFCKHKEKKNNGDDNNDNNDNDNDNNKGNGDSPKTTSNYSSFARKLQENWFTSLLEAVDAIRVVGGGDAQGADDLMKRLRQYNTACNYKQQKYSLLQEESEGYAKLMQYLCGSELPPSSSSSSLLLSSQTTKMQVFWKLVGTFELDPNRVLDLTLDVLESNLHSTQQQQQQQQQQAPRRRRPPTMTNSILWLLDVVSESPLDKLPALLRFKLTNHHRTATTTTATPTNTTDHVLETMALLVRQDLVDLSLLVNNYFDANTTFVSDLDAAYAIYRKKERDRVLALTRVSLSGNAANNGEATPKQIEFREQLQEAMQRLRFLEESHNNSSSSTGGEIESNANTNANKNATILSSYRILIQWGEWERVKPMLSPAQWNKLCCLLPESFGSAIINIAEDRTMEWMECTDLATTQEDAEQMRIHECIIRTKQKI